MGSGSSVSAGLNMSRFPAKLANFSDMNAEVHVQVCTNFIKIVMYNDHYELMLNYIILCNTV
jgi:hypothetical protein